MVGLIKLKGKIESFRVSFKAFQSLKGLIKANKIPTGNGPYGNRSTFYHVSLQLFPLDGIFYWIYTGNNGFCTDASPSYFRLSITACNLQDLKWIGTSLVYPRAKSRYIDLLILFLVATELALKTVIERSTYSQTQYQLPHKINKIFKTFQSHVKVRQLE